MISSGEEWFSIARTRGIFSSFSRFLQVIWSYPIKESSSNKGFPPLLILYRINAQEDYRCFLWFLEHFSWGPCGYLLCQLAQQHTVSQQTQWTQSHWICPPAGDTRTLQKGLCLPSTSYMPSPLCLIQFCPLHLRKKIRTKVVSDMKQKLNS